MSLTIRTMGQEDEATLLDPDENDDVPGRTLAGRVTCKIRVWITPELELIPREHRTRHDVVVHVELGVHEQAAQQVVLLASPLTCTLPTSQVQDRLQQIGAGVRGRVHELAEQHGHVRERDGGLDGGLVVHVHRVVALDRRQNLLTRTRSAKRAEDPFVRLYARTLVGRLRNDNP